MNSIGAEWWVVMNVLFGRHTPAFSESPSLNVVTRTRRHCLRSSANKRADGVFATICRVPGDGRPAAAECRKKDQIPGARACSRVRALGT